MQPLFINVYRSEYRTRVKCLISTVKLKNSIKKNCSEKNYNVSFPVFEYSRCKYKEKTTLTGNFFTEIVFGDVCHDAKVRGL